MDWSASGSVSGGGGGFSLEYSLNNGSSWTFVANVGGSSFSQSSSVDLLLPAGQNITQVQVRYLIGGGGGPGASGSVNGSVSNIRLDVETVNCPASVPTDRWRGEFYNNTNLSGSPTTVRDDGAGFLDFNFGDGDPPAGTCGLSPDYFSARWTRTLNFAPGTYRFHVKADDGVRLWVDNVLLIDGWGRATGNTIHKEVRLAAGSHAIRLEYQELAGDASVHLSWSGPIAPAGTGNLGRSIIGGHRPCTCREKRGMTGSVQEAVVVEVVLAHLVHGAALDAAPVGVAVDRRE